MRDAVWDAQKDMGLAAVGALVAELVTAVINRQMQHEFACEWSEGLKIADSKRYDENEFD